MKKEPIMFSWVNTKLEAKKTDNYGNGIFAKENIKKGVTLAVFGGHVVSIENEPEDTGIQIDDDLVLTGFNNNEPADYFNHSCEPNAGIKGQIFLVSMFNINKGDQITFDYAMCLYSKTNESYYSMRCLCQSKNCRKFITSDDWKNTQLQKKYDGYFQYFLQEKINKKIDL